MKKKWKIIFPIVVIMLIAYIMTFPKWLFPHLYPTYIETIERNWGISLPEPDNKETFYNTRGGLFGDGEAITVLVYKQSSDIQYIKDISDSWVSGEEFIEEIPSWMRNSVQDIMKEIDNDAKYFYLRKDLTDYVIFKLKGNELTIYESYT